MDFAPRDKFSVIDGVILNNMLRQVGLIGSPVFIPTSSVSRRRDTEGGASRDDSPDRRSLGATVPFNLDACFKMGEGK